MFWQVFVSHSAHRRDYVSSDDHQVNPSRAGGGYVSNDDQ